MLVKGGPGLDVLTPLVLKWSESYSVFQENVYNLRYVVLCRGLYVVHLL